MQSAHLGCLIDHVCVEIEDSLLDSQRREMDTESGKDRYGIIAAGKYVPPTVRTNHDISNMVCTSDEWIRDKTGISERRIASAHEATSDMAVKAAADALASANVDACDVNLLIVATSTPDYQLPSCASRVQGMLGCSRCTAFDVNATCSGWIHALDVSRRFLGTLGYEYAVVVGADCYSRIVDWTDRTTCILFGDGAGAVVLGPGGASIRNSWFRSDGTQSDTIMVKHGGSKHPIEGDRPGVERPLFQMQGRLVREFAVRAFVQAVREVCTLEGFDVENVDVIIPHQANLSIIREAMGTLNVPIDRAYCNLDRYGNTAAASVPIALCEALACDKVRPGSTVVFVSYGGGLAWGAVLVRF